MKLKKGLEFSTSDFWYDLTKGGYLPPDEICKNKEDAKKVKQAVRIVRDFEEACEEQIEGFLQ